MDKIATIAEMVHKARKRLVCLHYDAKTGHIGGSLSCIDALVVLQWCILKEDDVFLLSKGHSASALYVALWTCGLIGEESLRSYNKNGTLLAGHPAANETMKIPFGTGSLGHGASLAAGMALGKKMKCKDGRVFCLCSDGETQEGSFWEAIIFSSHHQLRNLVLIIDVNGWQGFGATQDIASQGCEELEKRLLAFNFDVLRCDGHDIEALSSVFSLGPVSITDEDIKPRAILMCTCKGKGVPSLEGQFISHYATPNEEEYCVALRQEEASV